MKRTEHISPQTRRIAKAVAPLSAADAKRAIVRATAYLRPELTRGGHSRFRVLGAELSLTRSDSKTAPVRRQIEVLIVDYLNRRHLRVAIEGSRVAEVRTSPASQPTRPTRSKRHEGSPCAHPSSRHSHARAESLSMHSHRASIFQGSDGLDSAF